MPIAPTFPGVYIEEIPSGVRSITGVATAVTAFIGRAVRGPADEPVTITSFADYERTFGGLALASSMSFAVRDFYLNGGGQAIIVRVHKDATAAALDLPTGAPAPDDVLALLASSPGAWGNTLSATVDHNTKDSNNKNLFNLAVSEGGGATETFLNVSIVATDARYLPRVLEQSSALVRVAKDGTGKDRVPNVRPSATPTTTVPNSGSDGTVLTSTQVLGSEPTKTGLFALEKADLFNLLCIPPYRADGNVDPSVVGRAAQYCETRRAMLLVDPPSEWKTPALAIAGLSDVGTRSKNAAVFFPRLRQPNPLRENQLDDFTPCGAVAGIMARTDAQRGVWKAPAGLDATLIGTAALTTKLTDADNGQLNPLGINCLRSFPVIGHVVWGARTLEGADRLASEWKYIPVRRLALFLEESLYRGTQFVVFEPNDETLWAQIRLNIGAFMQNLFRQGAFAGKTPAEAYFVKCDKETTTQNDINQGIVNIVIGFAPLKPAEFVILKFQQMAGQIAA
jgi:Bacteriophage tail sheath protein